MAKNSGEDPNTAFFKAEADRLRSMLEKLRSGPSRMSPAEASVGRCLNLHPSGKLQCTLPASHEGRHEEWECGDFLGWWA